MAITHLQALEDGEVIPGDLVFPPPPIDGCAAQGCRRQGLLPVGNGRGGCMGGDLQQLLAQLAVVCVDAHLLKSRVRVVEALKLLGRVVGRWACEGELLGHAPRGSCCAVCGARLLVSCRGGLPQDWSRGPPGWWGGRGSLG